MKKILFLFFSFVSLSLFASVEVVQQFAEMATNQYYDTQDWVKFPITNGYVDVEGGMTVSETVVVSFPKIPKLEAKEGFSTEYFTATDDEGMSYAISAMRMPQDFNFENSIKFLIEALTRSQDKNLILIGEIQYPSGHMGVYFGWVSKDNQFTELSIIKGQHFVYFLETSVTDEIYKDMTQIDADSPGIDKILHNFQKTAAFNASLSLET